MTIRDLLNQMTIEGWIKVQCWENSDYPEIYYEGYYIKDLPDKYKDRKVQYIFPYNTSPSEAAICIELEEDLNE